MRYHILTTVLALSTPFAVSADPATVEGVELTRSADAWRVSVTIRHADTGWEDYADGWRVELADGTVLGTRVLHHPHVEEQPFTRSLSGVDIPDGTTAVMIRARTNIEDWDTEAFGPYTVNGS